MRIATGAAVIGLAFLAGCAPGGALEDARYPTGSNTLVASSDYQSAYVVNTDAGTVARVTPSTGTTGNEVAVGSEPTRIARAGDRVFITLRGERRVAVLTETPSGLVEDAKIDVGAEPYGIVATEDGSRVYVANSQSDSVWEIDAVSDDILRKWTVPGEPRYLALHPSGRTLFVATGRGAAQIVQIDLSADGEQPTTPVAVPEVVRFDDSGEGELDSFALTPRITGDLAISPNGSELVVPVIYIDNITPVEDPELSPAGEPTGPVQDGYGASTQGIGRFNPGLAIIPLDSRGEPDIEAAEPVFLGGFRGNANDITQVRSYPAGVTIAPDNKSYLVSIQGSDAVAVVGALPFDPQQNQGFGGGEPVLVLGSEPDFDGEGVFTSLQDAGFSERPKSLVWTRGASGPDGVVFLDPKQAYVHGAFDKTFADLDYGNVFDGVVRSGRGGFDEFSEPRVFDISAPLTEFSLPEAVEAGRKLFYSATSPSMAASGAGVSCASCHSDGRNDGLTWTFSSGVRQTPSLAGQVSQTTPVTWTSQVESVAHEVRITTEARMGGQGLNNNQLANIAAYVDWTRVPDSEGRFADTEEIRRGQALFEREDVACASCHNGESFTDNLHYDIFGLTQVNTPTLLGIASSAPYLHDGRAANLRDLLEWSRTGAMGDTSMLSESEMNDLEAYLRSL